MIRNYNIYSEITSLVVLGVSVGGWVGMIMKAEYFIGW